MAESIISVMTDLTMDVFVKTPNVYDGSIRGKDEKLFKKHFF